MPLLCKRKYSYVNSIEPEKRFLENLSAMISEYNDMNKTVVFLCIGTDRATGDALGPLVGSYLLQNGLKNVYGTIDEPVHAENLEYYIDFINYKYKNRIIIAVDASLGRSEQIGAINIWKGPLHPGSGVAKVLGSIGDISITGVVNKMTVNPMFQLQNTRLALVINMAEVIGKALCKTVIY